MKLNIYTDDKLITVREVREVPRMKIPYRTADAVLDLFADMDLDKMPEAAVLGRVLKNKQHITAIVQATFALPDEDLACIDLMELGDLAREIIAYVFDKIRAMGEDAEDDDPNAQEQAQTTA